MALMTWSGNLATGIDIVDEQHHGLADMINRAAVLLLENLTRDEQKIKMLFNGLMDYAAVHFQTEEELMASRGIDPRIIAHHHHTHASFVDEISHMARQFTEGHRSCEDLLGFLAGRLLFHTLDKTRPLPASCMPSKRAPRPTKPTPMPEATAWSPTRAPCPAPWSRSTPNCPTRFASLAGNGRLFWFDIWLTQAEATLQEIKRLPAQDDTAAATLFEEAAPLLRQRLGADFDTISGDVAGFEFERALNAIESLEGVAQEENAI